MAEYFYNKDTSKSRNKLNKTNSKLVKSFGEFNAAVFGEGAIPLKYKELIAVAAAHVTRCPFCIAGHTKKAKEAGASDEEISEAIFIAVAMNAGASMAHSSLAMETLEQD